MQTSSYISMSEAAKRAPCRLSAKTIWRWCRRGLTVRSGTSIRLQHICVGGRVFTTAQWLEQFFAELAKADLAKGRRPKQQPAIK